MNAKIKTSKKDVLLFIIIGLAAGLVNGLLGTGGGLIVLLVIARKVKSEARAHAMSTACALIFSLLSAFAYSTAGKTDWWLIFSVAIGMSIGGYFGARLLGKLKGRTLKILLGSSLTVSGLLMLLL